VSCRFDDIQAAVWACTRCDGDREVEVRVRQQTPMPPADARLLVVATAPPYQRQISHKMKALSVHTDSKDRLRAFFVRALGQEWDELLRSGLAVLHAVKCAIVPKTAEEDERQHQNPPRRVVTRCAPPHFAEEFRELNAPVVVTLGVAALVAVRAACGSS
jgi:uracil-DNA glycosylase